MTLEGSEGPVAPPSTVSSPPRDFGPGGAPPAYFNDPDVITVDPLFDRYVQPNSPNTAATGSTRLPTVAGSDAGRSDRGAEEASHLITDR